MKPICAVCAIAKNENNYIEEWIRHYLKLGFDKIVLYDNNDLDGERLEDRIGDYIGAGSVDLIDARGKKSYQLEAFNRCYHDYADRVDWILFVDIDEFLTLESESNIQDFIERNNADGRYNVLAFRWRLYNDNGLLKVENDDYSVLSRFTKPANTRVENMLFKELIKTRIPDLCINSVHTVKEGPSIGESDELIWNSKDVIDTVHIGYWAESDFEHFCSSVVPVSPGAYIKHFRYKTIQEYLDYKVQRGYPMPFRNYGTDLGLFDFFNSNFVTDEKLEFIKN